MDWDQRLGIQLQHSCKCAQKNASFRVATGNKKQLENRAETKFVDWGRTMRLSGRVLFKDVDMEFQVA